MTVQNALEEMKERAFAPAFQKYLFDTYKVVAAEPRCRKIDGVVCRRAPRNLSQNE